MYRPATSVVRFALAPVGRAAAVVPSRELLERPSGVSMET
jgi:hypothetical protein